MHKTFAMAQQPCRKKQRLETSSDLFKACPRRSNNSSDFKHSQPVKGKTKNNKYKCTNGFKTSNHVTLVKIPVEHFDGLCDNPNGVNVVHSFRNLTNNIRSTHRLTLFSFYRFKTSPPESYIKFKQLNQIRPTDTRQCVINKY